MSRKGTELRGSMLFERYRGRVYHVADRSGRTYLCPCAPAMRIGGRIKHAWADMRLAKQKSWRTGFWKARSRWNP